MSAGTLQIRINVNFPVIFFTVMILHALLLAFHHKDSFFTMAKQMGENRERRPFQIKEIRTVGSKTSQIKNSTYLSKSEQSSKQIQDTTFAPKPLHAPNQLASEHKRPLSLGDLAESKTMTQFRVPKKEQTRPGTRPDLIAKKPKAINAISLKGQEIQKFISETVSARDLSGDPRARSLSNSDVLVNLEVPQGVNEDELNKYELMFYGFQRRTAINYINAFYKNLDKFQRENPHLSFPLTQNKQVMTGRLTYDEKGNVKQIKMIRWTNVTKLQNFFEDVLKDMDTLHNPPQALWKKDGEFSIFFSFIVNG